MRLPYSVEFGYINYILYTVSRLTENQENCDVGILVDTCKSQVFDGRISIEYHEILNICQHTDLLELNKGRTKITPLGGEFLKLNPSFQFEFTKGQKEFFAGNFIFTGPWKSQTKAVFKNFLTYPEEHTFVFRLGNGNIMSPEFRAQIQILYILGILALKENSYQVNSKYVKFIVGFRNEESGFSLEDLDERLRRNRDQGAKAEELIVEYEKKRLSFLERVAETDRVVLISHLETSAGYDIRSFDGDSPTIEHDRFIEVKSSENRALSFHWSNNEMTIAKNLGDQYWIYYLGGFNINQNLEDIEPILIQNPYEKLLEHADIVCKPNNYRVFQEKELDYQDLEYFKGKCL